MKKILTFILLIIVTQTTKAQTDIDTARIVDIAMASDYIFEGKVVEICTYEDADGNIFTNNIIDISRFVKGQLNCGTVSVVTRGGQYENRDSRVSHTTRFTIGVIGIFFCVDNNQFPQPFTECNIATDNPMSLTTTITDFSYIGYYTDFINEIAEGQNSQFASLQELYDFINNNTPFQLINCNPGILAKVYDYQKALNNKSIPLTNSSNKPKKKIRTDYLDYQFVNFEVTGVSPKYFEFDVQINSNTANLYLHESAFRLKYNPQAFGTNIASNVQVNLATGFPASTYNYIQKIDKSDSVVSIWTHPAVNGQPKTLISSTFFQDFLHIKIPMPNCDRFPNIYTDTFSNILDYSEYTIDPFYTQAQAVPFDYVFLDDTLAGTLCYPQITEVKSQATGTNITSAGTHDVITLRGNHFGANSDSASVLLLNADDMATYFPIQKSDVVIWTDTMMKFVLYSNFDSTNSNPILNTSYAQTVPASCNVGFINKWHLRDSMSSNHFLDINYALANLVNEDTTLNIYYKSKAYLFGVQPAREYAFRMNSNITNDSMKWCIQAAFNHWRCLTGVNFVLDTTPTNKIVNYDFFNTVVIDNNLASNTIALATVSLGACIDASQPVGEVYDIDISINQSLVSQFFYDTTGTKTKPMFKRDFYRAIKHEIGHALLQWHVADEHDLMYHADIPFADSVIGSQRNSDFRTMNNIAGDSIVYSSVNQNLYNYGCPDYYPMILQDTCSIKIVNGINDISKSDILFDAYPNPTSSIIYFNLPIEGNKTIRIFDLTGRLINISNTKSNKAEYNVSNLPKGIYVAELILDSNRKTIKFICE